VKDPTTKRMWTFLIEGGEPFEVTMEGHPPLQHDGHRTLWKAYVPMEDILAVDAALAQAVGPEGSVTKHIECSISPEDAYFPQEHISQHGKVVDFRHPQCPLCSWFSPYTETTCGLQDWVHEMVCSHLNFPKAKEDFDNCPDRQS